MLFVTFPSLLLIFYLCNFFQFDYYVSWCVPPWVYPSWDSLCFLDFIDYFLSPAWEVFRYYLFKYFLRSFLSLFSFYDPYNVNAFNVVPEVSQAVIISFYSFFYILLCGSDLNHSVLQVIFPFFCFSYSAIDSLCIIHPCLFALYFLADKIENYRASCSPELLYPAS